MLASFRSAMLNVSTRPSVLKTPSLSHKPISITSPHLAPKTQVMGVKKVPKTLRTKSAAKKRFRVTARGHLKCWPSSLHGRARIIKKAGLRNSTAIHLAKLLPNHGWKPVTKSTAKSQYLLQDQEFDGI